MARLILLSGEEIGKEYPVDGETLLGRNPQCAVSLPHGSVSREHARIVFEAGRAAIVDLQSSNGTFVNGKRVEKSVLQPGDEIRLGQFSLRFAAEVEIEEIRLEEDPAPAEPVPVPAQPSSPAGGAAQAPSRKAISKNPVRPIAVAPREKSALLGQDVLQYGGYYRFALLLGAMALAAGVFFGVKFLSAKMAEKAQQAEPVEEDR